MRHFSKIAMTFMPESDRTLAGLYSSISGGTYCIFLLAMGGRGCGDGAVIPRLWSSRGVWYAAFFISATIDREIDAYFEEFELLQATKPSSNSRKASL